MPATKPRTKKAKRAAMRQTMDEFKKGQLHSGSKTGPKVTNPKQAIAIGLSQSGQSRSSKKSSGKSRRSSTRSKSVSRRKRLENVTF